MTELIAIVALTLVAWFAAGTTWNIRRGHLLMRWMQGGLPMLGERSTVRWHGSSAVEMTIRDGKPPFVSVSLVIFLEARDVPWMWALGRARGRRDTVILRGVLRQIPQYELEALDGASWSGREALARVPKEWSVRQPIGAGDVVVYCDSVAVLERAVGLLAEASTKGLDVRRLSLRRAEPHFQIHVDLPEQRQPALGFFKAVQGIAERALV